MTVRLASSILLILFILLIVFIKFLPVPFLLLLQRIIITQQHFRPTFTKFLDLPVDFCQRLFLLLQKPLLFGEKSLQQGWHFRSFIDLEQVGNLHLAILVNDQLQVFVFLWQRILVHIIGCLDPELPGLLHQVTEDEVVLLADTAGTPLEQVEEVMVRVVGGEGESLEHAVTIIPDPDL